jgi:hypothetical protein
VQGQILSQAEIHRFFLKTSVLILAFLITSVLSQLVNLASSESKFYEAKSIAKAEVTYYKNLEQSIPKDKVKIETSKLKSKPVISDIKLKLAIAEAKVESAEKSINTNDSIVGLNKAITDICIYLSPIFFIIGVAFWFLHLPYVQVPIANSTNKAVDLNENEFLVSILAKNGKNTKHHVTVHNKPIK